MGESTRTSSIYTTMKLIAVLLAGLCLATVESYEASDSPLLGTYSLETADGSFKHSGNLEMHPAALARFRDFGMQMFGIMNSVQGRSSGGFDGNQESYQVPF